MGKVLGRDVDQGPEGGGRRGRFTSARGSCAASRGTRDSSRRRSASSSAAPATVGGGTAPGRGGRGRATSASTAIPATTATASPAAAAAAASAASPRAACGFRCCPNCGVSPAEDGRRQGRHQGGQDHEAERASGELKGA